MRSFWWFRKPLLAGFAQPGLNDVRWDELSFYEAILVGWIGVQVRGQVPLTTLANHAQDYGKKIQRFYPGRLGDLPNALALAQATLSQDDSLVEICRGLSRIELLSRFDVDGDALHFELSPTRLEREIEFLKAQGLRRLVCLTEEVRNHEVLRQHFSIHALPIADVGVPTVGQVQELARIFKAHADESIGVYCLAGLGRTSIMLMGAHMVNGEPFEKLRAEIARVNPAFVLAGQQEQFMKALAGQI